jgi:hypothetical protein
VGIEAVATPLEHFACVEMRHAAISRRLIDLDSTRANARPHAVLSTYAQAHGGAEGRRVAAGRGGLPTWSGVGPHGGDLLVRVT